MKFKLISAAFMAVAFSTSALADQITLSAKTCVVRPQDSGNSAASALSSWFKVNGDHDAVLHCALANLPSLCFSPQDPAAQYVSYSVTLSVRYRAAAANSLVKADLLSYDISTGSSGILASFSSANHPQNSAYQTQSVTEPNVQLADLCDETKAYYVRVKLEGDSSGSDTLFTAIQVKTHQ